MIEAGIAAGYVIAWAIRKAQRAAGRLDAEVDQVIDGGLDRLHEVVATKLGDHPVMAELVEEAESQGDTAGVSDLTRQRIELELVAAAQRDEAFGLALATLVDRLREAERTEGQAMTSGPGSSIFTGNSQARSDGGGIAIGQAGAVSINHAPTGPHKPGRDSQ